MPRLLPLPGRERPAPPARLRILLLAPLALLLLGGHGHAARAQNWRNENFERPIDLEASGDDDSFEDEEMEETEDLYSGSGSGYFEQDSGIKAVLPVTTEVPIVLTTTTAAVLPVTSVQPVGIPFVPFPTEEATAGPTTGDPLTPRMSEAPAVTVQKASGAPTMAPTTPASTKPTTVSRVLVPFITVLATTQPVTLETPTAVVVTKTEATTSLPVTTSVTKVRLMPTLSTSQEPEVSEESTTPLPPLSPTASTESVQTDPLDVGLSTAITSRDPEPPVSGDFEIREEEDVAPTELSNEVAPLVTPAAGPVLRKNVETGLIDNTIESGNSAAQLPQKNILERKEVLIAVIVGGVVGALFAAFLVMLLIYRMKKKDEGSYTLEEPKQASVTYQKPDKQEEFYA
ncbi:syndecan-3 [Anolis carolinensis]|uniref:syndecan-3 n=1 Tax=Anolis carolinensis TaxID=28377 RepID=UPI002F2B3962